jgi:hypothetical protein
MKIKIFPLLLSSSSIEKTINKWLEENKNIEVLSVKVADNKYIILYK